MWVWISSPAFTHCDSVFLLFCFRHPNLDVSFSLFVQVEQLLQCLTTSKCELVQPFGQYIYIYIVFSMYI